MPTLSFPIKDLKRFLAEDVDVDTIREAMTMIGTDIASFDEEVVVEVFPNRPDLLSVQGLARAINHFLELKEEVDAYSVDVGDGVVTVLPSAEYVRPHTRCAIIRGLTFDDATIKHVIDVQEKLHVTFGRNRKRVAIGIYPLEKIVFPITFGGEKPEEIVFRPLEGEKEMTARELLAQHPAGIKYGALLEGKKVYPIFRDAKKRVLSVPPIINSHDVGKITKVTKDVFIECSGHDPKPLSEALTMLCAVLADLGGKIERVKVVYQDQELFSPEMSIKKAQINRKYVVERAGIPDEALEKSLMRMGISLDRDTVSIPCYRTDFLHDVDVVEDALIGYGYQNIIPRIPNVATVGKLSASHVRERAMRDVLEGLGLVEVMTFLLRSSGVPLANPLSENYSSLRTNLLTSLFEVLEKNTSRQYPQDIFEIGTVFTRELQESSRLSVVLCGGRGDFTTCRQMLEALGKAMGWRLGFEETEDKRFIPGRIAKISGTVNGVLGEVHPEELVSRGVQQPSAAFEITF